MFLRSQFPINSRLHLRLRRLPKDGTHPRQNQTLHLTDGSSHRNNLRHYCLPQENSTVHPQRKRRSTTSIHRRRRCQPQRMSYPQRTAYSQFETAPPLRRKLPAISMFSSLLLPITNTHALSRQIANHNPEISASQNPRPTQRRRHPHQRFRPPRNRPALCRPI